jgi:ATP-dependent DNA helicase DinG
MWQWFKLQSKNDKRMIVLQSNDIERHALVKKHKKRIDAGKKSLLVGVQSLAEGLDLPRQYLTWLGIAKIPFSDPFGNVVDACEAELLKAKGMDPFFHMALADASTRLTQYTGRAIRSEDDTCQVHIFDSRMNRHWAQSLLANLPPMPITYKSA